MSSLPHLVYWYQKGWSEQKDFKAFSLVAKRRIVPYHEGIERNYDKILAEKLDGPSKHDLLTEEEHKLLNGIELMKQDQNLAKADREG